MCMDILPGYTYVRHVDIVLAEARGDVRSVGTIVIYMSRHVGAGNQTLVLWIGSHILSS